MGWEQLVPYAPSNKLLQDYPEVADSIDCQREEAAHFLGGEYLVGPVWQYPGKVLTYILYE